MRGVPVAKARRATAGHAPAVDRQRPPPEDGASCCRLGGPLARVRGRPATEPNDVRPLAMPSFGRDGDLLTISYIAGPRHVWLGVRFADEHVAEPVIVKRPPVGSCDHGVLDPARIVASVVAGAEGTGKFPQRIEYVENDSPAYGLYEHCGRLLAQHAANGT